MKNEIPDIKFINDTHINENSFLWRYIDTSKLFSFLLNQSFFCTRLDKFEDSKEGITLNHLILKKSKIDTEKLLLNNGIGNYISTEVAGGEMNKIDDELNQIQKSNFANCWFIADELSESVAMWNLYSSPNSVAIKIKYSDFKKNLLKNGFISYDKSLEITCGPIKYINFSNPNSDGIDLIDSVFLKDLSFQHENEFRIIIKKEFEKIPVEYHPKIYRKISEKLHQIHEPLGINLKINHFEDYNFEIVFHPKSQDWIKNDIKKITKLSNVNLKFGDSLLELK